MLVIQVLLSIISFVNFSFATRYIPLSINDKVSGSSIIVTGTIVSLACVDEFGSNIPPGENCTAPGLKNKKWYKFQVKNVIKDAQGVLNKKRSKGIIDFKFSSKAYTSVPEDNYASSSGKLRIAYLNIRDEEFEPVHSAFYFDNTNKLKEVLESILKNQEASKVVDSYALVKADKVKEVCFHINSGTLQALKSYRNCTNKASQKSASGSCSRTDGSSITFFKSLSDCKSFQSTSS